METVTIKMSRRQAEIVSAACEEYCRLRMGQFWDLANELAEVLYPGHEEFDKKIDFRNEFESQCREIFDKHWRLTNIPEQSLIAETVWLAIRSKLAWHDHPEGNVMDVRFDPVFSRCDEKIPKVTIHD